jgi:hypothetical protein
MPNDTRELPAANDGLYRFLGGSPLTVAFRLILLSILVGVVLAGFCFSGSGILALTPSTGYGATSCSAP